mmetsp:Transcript_24259/g.55814  ORF Transcript_24259/g.55814 Transcript_24259/m.55814 type:complete len:339 (+) Transcript_24259:237-1253(+)
MARSRSTPIPPWPTPPTSRPHYRNVAQADSDPEGAARSKLARSTRPCSARWASASRLTPISTRGSTCSPVSKAASRAAASRAAVSRVAASRAAAASAAATARSPWSASITHSGLTTSASWLPVRCTQARPRAARPCSSGPTNRASSTRSSLPLSTSTEVQPRLRSVARAPRSLSRRPHPKTAAPAGRRASAQRPLTALMMVPTIALRSPTAPLVLSSEASNIRVWCSSRRRPLAARPRWQRSSSRRRWCCSTTRPRSTSSTSLSCMCIQFRSARRSLRSTGPPKRRVIQGRGCSWTKRARLRPPNPRPRPRPTTTSTITSRGLGSAPKAKQTRQPRAP